ncbi:MFS transporter [Croceicoccus sediminis]|uniref:MFS transporter n=1 Tax=Croceicoccus sediminis TaxID=2571150 RepID=UPI001478C9F3|nr:MFS transporter [Croceicoccus sediminis]
MVAQIALGTAGVVTFLAMPVVVSAMVNDLAASEREVGLFSTVQLATISAGCLLSTFLPQGRFRRHGLAALAVMIGCDLATLLGPGWVAFNALRAIAGIAGGVAVSQATAALSRSARPERSFGLFLALQTVVSIACIYAMPALMRAGGFHLGYLVFLAFDFAAIGLVYAFVPKRAGAAAPHARLTGNDAAGWWQSAAMLLSILFFFVGIGAIWTFLALLGEQIALTEGEVAGVLSLSKLVAFVASFLPGILVARLGRTIPILACVVLLTGAVIVYSAANALTGFVIATVMFSTGWYVLYPLQLGALADVDRDGRPMLSAGALTGAGLGIGPGLTVMVADGLSGIYIISAAAFLLVGLFAMPVLVPSARRRKAEMAL